ncbi:FAD-dependent oxidoreductase [Shinella kummerowiae]|uniref:FAD-dependent oxidoreductase n=1 Tax=Shinella kummerowiae TaxID=417745 RepID=A0A6N8SD59_9HYPH|nr:FAD-dependent oxidoreductase [Shinella kummerowiae]MXN45508.1 FAD-dependent oxidoreductase [Shinella kummerowiae]
MTETHKQSIIVIGAGFIGLTAALTLLRDGHRVAIVDRAPPLDGSDYRHACSYGNACTIAPHGVVPVATPGVAWRVPGMLANPLGPLAIDWKYLPRLAPWLLGFLSASRTGRVERIAATLSTLLKQADAAWRPLMEEAGAMDLREEHGCLYLYKSNADRAASDRDADFRSRHGVNLARLSADDIRALEPNLPANYAGGVLFKDAYVVASPEQLARRLAKAVLARGGRFITGDVRGLRIDAESATAVLADETLGADRIVVAAGAWSKSLGASIGDHIRLDTERGYHVLFPQGRGLLRRPVCYTEHGFYMTPMADGLRAAGTVELAGLAPPLNERRTSVIRNAVAKLLPAAGTGTSEWLGLRPSMPDSLPVIGKSPRTERVIYAFGHGHLGLTLAGVTGALLSDLISDRATHLDVTALRPIRRL